MNCAILERDARIISQIKKEQWMRQKEVEGAVKRLLTKRIASIRRSRTTLLLVEQEKEVDFVARK